MPRRSRIIHGVFADTGEVWCFGPRAQVAQATTTESQDITCTMCARIGGMFTTMLRCLNTEETDYACHRDRRP
jgi:protein-disulfide isomerase-like protein with CxxC motif